VLVNSLSDIIYLFSRRWVGGATRLQKNYIKNIPNQTYYSHKVPRTLAHELRVIFTPNCYRLYS